MVCRRAQSFRSNRAQIDSSRDRGKPFQFTLGKGEVIRGWEEGIARVSALFLVVLAFTLKLVQMSKGERANLKISSDMGYGPNGIPGTIPPNATLCFDVELIDFK